MPTPEWLQNISGYLQHSPMVLVDPIGSTLRTAIEIEDEARRNQWELKHSPMQEAMIPRKENIAQFMRNVMRSNVPKSIIQKHPEIGTAMAIAEARYPNHIANAKKFGDIRIDTSDTARNSGSEGWFSPSSSNIDVVAKLPTPRDSPYIRIKNYFNTLLHEAAHSDQFNRESSKFDKNELLVNSVRNPQGTYITPEVSKRIVGNDSMYRNQPVEVDAFRRGTVAENAMKSFLSLLPTERNRIAYDKVPENLTTDMEQVASYFNRAIKLAAKSGSQSKVDVLKNQKTFTLWKMKNHADPNNFTPTFEPTDYVMFPGDILDSSLIARQMRTRLAPLAKKSPADLKVDSLIRQVQDAKGVGPLQEWLRNSLTIERGADKRVGSLVRHMDELANSYKGTK